MSMLIHRCDDCTHPDFFHTPEWNCSHGCCPCRNDNFNPEPEAIPTFDPWTLALIEAPMKPGQRMAPNIKQCECERCTELLTA